MFRTIVIAMILSTATIVSGTEPLKMADKGREKSLLNHINEFQAGFDAANRLSGVLLVVSNDTVLIDHAFRTSDNQPGPIIDLDSEFPIASITKILTAVIIYQLVKEGKLSEDDRLSDWIPAFPGGADITIDNLLNHRAGIRHRVATESEEFEKHNAEEVVNMAARYPLVFSPGTEYSYSTAGYAILARVAELADTMSFAEVIRRRLFIPAEMHSSYDCTELGADQNAVLSYVPRHGKLVPTPMRDLSFLIGGGSVVSTAMDLYKFAKALLDGKLSPAVFSDVSSGSTAFWVGATSGYFSWLKVDPEKRLFIVYLSNTWGGAGPALLDALPKILQGESATPPEIPNAIDTPPTELLMEYVGEYQTRPGATMEVKVTGQELQLSDNYLVPIGPDRFWQPAWSQPVHFVRDSTDQVIALVREKDTKEVRWPKVESSR